MPAYRPRDRILDAALKLATEGSFERTSIEVLARASETSTGTIYHHFGSKHGVFDALLMRTVAPFQQELRRVLLAHRTDAAGGVREAVRLQLEWAEAHRAEAKLLVEGWDVLLFGGSAPFQRRREHFASDIEAWLQAHAEAGRLPRVGLGTAYALVFAPGHAVVEQWVRWLTPAPPSAFAARLGDAAWAALRAAGPDDVL